MKTSCYLSNKNINPILIKNIFIPDKLGIIEFNRLTKRGKKNEFGLYSNSTRFYKIIINEEKYKSQICFEKRL